MDINTFLHMVDDKLGGMHHARYLENIRSGQRTGQAFMNALRDTPYYEKLTGSQRDPFYSDNLGAVYAAIEWVTR